MIKRGTKRGGKPGKATSNKRKKKEEISSREISDLEDNRISSNDDAILDGSNEQLNLSKQDNSELLSNSDEERQENE